MKVISSSVNDTLRLGMAIARNLKKGDIVCLSGELGSGKTVLVKGIAQGLGIAKKHIISPSFVLIRLHTEGRLPLYHFDLYRLKDPVEISSLGYEEYFFDAGVAVIEWAERLKYLVPEERLSVQMSVKGSSRRVLEFSARGRRYTGLLRKINEDIGD